MNDDKEKMFEPSRNSRFNIELLDHEGFVIFPSYLVNGISDKKKNKVEIQAYLSEIDGYESLLNEDVVSDINLYWLDSTGSPIHSIQYSTVKLRSYTFTDLSWKEEASEEDITNLHLTYEYSNKEWNESLD